MKRYIILLIITFIAANVIAQNDCPTPQNGIISVQNSAEKNAGKREYVSNVQLKSDHAKNVTSDSYGKFQLCIYGPKYGEKDKIQILSLPDKYKDYFVVNEKFLREDFVLQYDTISIFIRKKEEWNKEKEELLKLQINNSVLLQENDKLRTRLEEERKKTEKSEERYKEITDSLKKISESEEKILESINFYVEQLMFINLDDLKDNVEADIRRKKAYQCAQRGEIDSVYIYLQFDEIKEQIAKTQRKIEELQTAHDNIEQILWQEINEKNQYIKDLMFLAQTKATQNKYYSEDVEKIYQEAINADTTNYANVWEFANYLCTIGDGKGYIYFNRPGIKKAERYYFICLRYYISLTERNTDYLPQLAALYSDLGFYYSVKREWNDGKLTHYYDIAKDYYDKSLKIYEYLSKTNPDKYLPYVAGTLSNLVHIYVDRILYRLGSEEENCKNAEIYYPQGVNVYEKIIAKNFFQYTPDYLYLLHIIRDYFCKNQHDQKFYEKKYVNTLKYIVNKFANKTTLEGLNETLENVAEEYVEWDKYKDSEKYYLQWIGIWEKTAGEDTVKLLKLANQLEHIIILHLNWGDEKAENIILLRLKVWENLIQKDNKYLSELYDIDLSFRWKSNKKEKQYYAKWSKVLKQYAKSDSDLFYVADAFCNLAAYYSGENSKEFQKWYSQSLETLDKVTLKDTTYLRKLSEILYKIGDYYYYTNQYEKADTYYSKWFEVRKKYANGDVDKLLDIAKKLKYIGDDKYFLGKIIKEKYYLRSAEIYEEIAMTCEQPDILKKTGEYCFEVNQSEKADICYSKWLEVSKQYANGDVDKLLDIAGDTRSIANNFYFGRYFYDEQYAKECAEKYYLQSAEILESLSKTDSEYFTEVAHTLGDLGDYYRLTDKYDKAEKYYLRELEILENLSKTDSVYFIQAANTLYHIAQNYNSWGKFEKAEQSARSALKINSLFPAAKQELAYSLLFLGHYQKAESIFKEFDKDNYGWFLMYINIYYKKNEKNISKERKADIEKMKKMLKE